MRYTMMMIVLFQVSFLGPLKAQTSPKKVNSKSSEIQNTFFIYPDSVLNNVSNHPVGINLDYFMDDDKYLKPKRPLAEVLKAMGVKFLRYPGGNKSDFYFFSRPPYNKSIPTLARTGKDAVGGRNRALNADANGYKNDVLDFDEFITLCREVGAEPVIVVAADEYLVDYPKGSTWSTREQLINHAVEWVKYSNIKKKFNVKYWMIGNESWGPENKNSTAEIYAQDVLDFSKAMKAIDPSIKIIPNGNSEEWWKVILKKDAGNIDAICISNYPVYNLKNGFNTYRDSIIDFMGPVKTAINSLNIYATPEDKKKIKIIVAEYGPFDWAKTWPFVNNMGYNLANFEQTGEQLLQPRIDFSCFWNTRWIENDSVKNSVFDAIDRDGNFNANGFGIMIWGNYLKKFMVKSTSNVSVRSFASYDPSSKSLFAYLLNKTNQEKTIKIKIPGFKISSIKQTYELTSNGPDDTDPKWTVVDNSIKKDVQNLKGTSIKVVEYKLR